MLMFMLIVNVYCLLYSFFSVECFTYSMIVFITFVVCFVLFSVC